MLKMIITSSSKMISNTFVISNLSLCLFFRLKIFRIYFCVVWLVSFSKYVFFSFVIYGSILECDYECPFKYMWNLQLWLNSRRNNSLRNRLNWSPIPFYESNEVCNRFSCVVNKGDFLGHCLSKSKLESTHEMTI